MQSCATVSVKVLQLDVKTETKTKVFLPPGYTLHSTLYTLHPAPYTLNPTPYTLHPTPYTLPPTPYTLHPTPYTLRGCGFRVSSAASLGVALCSSFDMLDLRYDSVNFGADLTSKHL